MNTSDMEKIILFDGTCILCNRSVQFLLKMDKRKIFKFAPLQSSTGKEILNTINTPSGKLDTIVYKRNLEYFFKSTAVLYILKDLGNGWQVAYALIIIPRFIRDFIYDIIAKTRYKIFGKRVSCMVPSDDLKDRFID